MMMMLMMICVCVWPVVRLARGELQRPTALPVPEEGGDQWVRAPPLLPHQRGKFAARPPLGLLILVVNVRTERGGASFTVVQS